MRAHERPVVHDEARGLQVRFARGSAEITAAAEYLDLVEGDAGAPLVDESERARLDEVATFDGDPAKHWHPLLVWRDHDLGGDGAARPVGYGGLALAAPLDHAVGDVVVSDVAVVDVLLDAVRHVADDHGGATAEVWARHVDDAFVEVATSAGWQVHRRLWVLGRTLDEPPSYALPDGVDVRSHDGSGADDHAVADLLARAYEGTADGGWTVGDVSRRRDYAWFDPTDLLLAFRGDRLQGLHWTKRRDGDTGEVYNLAVHPDAQGTGLGAALLGAGLAHLAEVGMRDVVLWVDDANTAGRRLYARHGFEPRWQDVSLTCRVCD